MGRTAGCVALVYESPWRRIAEKVDEGTPIPTLPSTTTWSDWQTRRVALLWCMSRPGAEKLKRMDEAVAQRRAKRALFGGYDLLLLVLGIALADQPLSTARSLVAGAVAT